MRFEDLPAELQEKAKACETPEEIVEFAKREGVDLTDDELDQISAGAWGGASNTCPNCHQRNFHTKGTGADHMQYVCNKCGCVWG